MMTCPFNCSILIVGAGASGLTLAIDLARRGVSFRLIDKLNSPFAGSRGKGIQPRSQEVLEDLEVLDRIAAIGGEYPPQRKYRDDGSYEDSSATESVSPSAEAPYHAPLLVPQFLTERVLRERLVEVGGVVEFGCELLEFDADVDGVTARLRSQRGEETLRIAYLIGCDGGRSFVRHALGLGFPGKTLGVRAVVADVYLDGLGRDAWHRWNEGSMQRQIALCPLAGTTMFQLQAPVPAEGEVDLSAAGLTRMVHERTGCNEIVIHKVSWSSPYQMNVRLSDRYRDGRVFLAGDAAHIHPPTGGQGLNTSMQDAYNLGWKLAAVLNGAPNDLLDTYEEERRPVAASMLGLATKLLDASRQGDTRRGREVYQLDIGYPQSSLALENPERRKFIFAGDRAPDALMRGAAGQPTRLFRLLAGPHWTAVSYCAARGTGPVPRTGLHIHRIGDDGDLHDDHGYFVAAYGVVPGDWVLIRPDGYVGAIVDAEGVGMLDAYLAKVGLVVKI